VREIAWCGVAGCVLLHGESSVVRRRAKVSRTDVYSRAAGPEHVMLRVVVLMRGKMEPTHAEDRTPRTATD